VCACGVDHNDQICGYGTASRAESGTQLLSPQDRCNPAAIGVVQSGARFEVQNYYTFKTGRSILADAGI
jgi:hypothetical protein